MKEHHHIEEKWNRVWQNLKLRKFKNNPERKKYYLLEMFAYPSGDLHMGHLRNYVIGDVLCRYKLMNGFDVLHPVGWDAFGLPAEEAAIKRGIAPDEWTMNNIGVSSQTLKTAGLLYDWDREVITCREDYYKWTQWLFIQMFRKGLAYRKEAFVNWCPSCRTVLANEQVEQGKCWRCKSEVKKEKKIQWFFKITDYAQRLLDDIDTLEDWPENVRTMQKNWIGRSEGLTISFKTEKSGIEIEIFTTRPDTLFGVTFMAIAPESDVVNKLPIRDEYIDAVKAYIEKSIMKTEIERTQVGEKDGVFTGLYAVNPLNGSRVQIWIADYVLASYGTGAVMAVPAHDTRDFAFAKKYGIEIKQVIKPDTDWDFDNDAYTESGTLFDSGEFSGMDSENAIMAINDFAEQKGLGSKTVNFRIRDWLVSRQRYWGAPIPMIHCSKCGVVPVPDEQLPVLLPDSKGIDYTPKGVSPLASSSEYMNVKCPVCGGPAERDPDTMDTFVDSSWYQLRYTDAQNEKEIFSKGIADRLMPVDMYIGGIEHANGHLIYFRFITKVLSDMGLVSCNEPAAKLINQGMIMDDKGQIMSKSKDNAVPVGPFFSKFGVDLARGTMLFIGPAYKDAIWSENGITGMQRYIDRLTRFAGQYAVKGNTECRYSTETEKNVFIKLNQVIKSVSSDIELFEHNTAISSLMELLNMLYHEEQNLRNEFISGILYEFLKLNSVFLPHISEELFSTYCEAESIFLTEWPVYNKDYLVSDTVTVVVQINGKLRSKMEVSADADEEYITQTALEDSALQKYLEGRVIVKKIYIRGKLLNIVVK